MACFTKSMVSAASLGLGLSWLAIAPQAIAAPPETAPAQLISAIDNIEAAANQQDIDQVMALYSPAFQGPDGFTREQYQMTLTEFWGQYSNLTYDVELLAWESEGTALIAETLTTVTGTRSTVGRDMNLTAEVRSRQRFENGQVVSQEILSEQTQLASGERPPSVEILLPESVTPGERFNFDAIVEEPLGDRLLLGIAVDEGVTAEDFLTPRPLDLQALSAGGLFKIGKAPEQPDHRWISSVLVRNDGFVIDTRRLNVEN
ncbi:nuclear transport factor 2 family protein [Oscillatoria sp. CS-180]|uniref:nuclear transport factor 2 family protein n=1 Tax=Oscillatoria sp. CS-180 TaxID=3021720 RepID=UPI00232DA9B1|nr:nuclear transport factor 2 family protein [Oscillatoria sp. CS-180]MDB9529411.1 nuclear transport factor 2 family protein [Oscillatoria sp. CS-180]